MGVRLKCKTGQVDAECFLGNGRQQIMDGTTNRTRYERRYEGRRGMNRGEKEGAVAIGNAIECRSC